MVRSNYLLSWKARSLGKEGLHRSATRKDKERNIYLQQNRAAATNPEEQ